MRSSILSPMAKSITLGRRIFVIAFFLTCLSGLQAVEIGMERILLIHELGRPTYSVTRGETELMTYPAGVRITLKSGRVTEIVGIKSAANAPGNAQPVTAAPVERAPSKAETDEFARMEKESAAADSKARAKMEKAIEDMEEAHDHPVRASAPAFDLKKFALGLALKWLLTLAALKLTCKYWGAEIFWSGLMTVAMVDVVLRGIMGAIGLVWLQMPSLFYADEAVAAVAMVLILRKVSINQSMRQAVQITMTTKTFSVVVGSVLATILLRMIP